MVDMARTVPQFVEPVPVMLPAILLMAHALIVRLDILRTIVTRVSSNIKMLSLMCAKYATCNYVDACVAKHS